MLSTRPADLWDFAAGQDFAEVRLHFKHDRRGDCKDSFPAYFDQMWQSEFYLQSETLTCITCHDPHQAEPIVDLVDWRRQQCNNCNSDDQICGLPLGQRMQRAENNCVQCHMPSIEADVPHTSTTSHLIAIYDSGKPRGVELTESEIIRRVEASPKIDDRLLTRADAVANATWDVNQALDGNSVPLESVQLDEDLNAALLAEPDPFLYSLLARLNRWRAEQLAGGTTSDQGNRLSELWSKVIRNATKALETEKISFQACEGALESLGNQQMQARDFAAAADSFAELT